MISKRPSIYQTYGSLDNVDKKVTKSELIDARNKHNYKKPERYEPEVSKDQIDISENAEPESTGIHKILYETNSQKNKILSETNSQKNKIFSESNSQKNKILSETNSQKNKILSTFSKIVFFFNKKLSKTIENGVVLSPISIIFAIINVYLGSIGNTRLEIKNSLDISEKDNTIFQYLINSNKLLNITTNDLKVRCSNTLVMRANFQIEQNYANILNTLSSDLIYFTSSTDAIQKTNIWIAKNTDNLVKNIISHVPNDINLFLINVIHFKGTWQKQFLQNETKEEIFYKFNKTTSLLPMMHTKNNFYYFEDDIKQCIMLDYKNRDYAMIVCLPKSESTTFDFDPFSYTYTKCEVNITLPKFTHRSKNDVVMSLKKLGITELFNPINKDLFNISRNQVCVNNIIHDAIVIIDEEGVDPPTKFNNSDTFTFNANHSFYYAIVHKPEQLILFNGVF